MNTPLKLLMVEDFADDAELLLYTLRRSGYEVTWQRVDTPETMRTALLEGTWDIITSDHAMPRFSAPTALALARELRPEIPLIIVSGEIDLNLAVSLMKGGAQDYIQKSELARVVPALERELDDAANRRRQHQTEDALQHHMLLMARIYDTSPVGIVMVDASGQITFANREAERLLGLTKDNITQLMYNAPFWHITAFDGGPFPEEELPFARVMGTNQPVRDVRHAIEWPDGRRVLLSINATPLTDDAGTVTGMVSTLYDITDQIGMADSLRESESLFRTLVHSMDDIIFTLDLQGRHTGVFGGWVEKAGLTPGYFLGRSACEIMGVDAGCVHEEACQRVIQGETVVYDWEAASPDGSPLCYQTSLSPIYEGDRIVGVVGVARDVTALKRAKAELQADHAFRTAVIGSAATGLCVCHNVPEYPFVQFTIWNERMTELTGYSLEEINQAGWYQAVYPDPQFRQQAIERMDQMRVGNNLQHETWTITCKDGRQKVIEISTSVVQTGEGVTHVLGLMNDVTERRQAEEVLRVRDAQLQATLENTPHVAVQWYDPEGRVVYWNPASETLYGWSVQDALGKTLDQLLYTPEENAAFLDNLRRIAATGRAVSPFESPYHHRDGCQGVILSTQFAIPSEGGQSLFVCMDVDITQMKQAQQNLETLFNTLDALFFVLDMNGRILHVNQAVCRKLGFAAEELHGQSVLIIHTPAHHQELTDIMAGIMVGETNLCLVPMQTKDGRQIPVETRVMLGEWDGKPALFGISGDISALQLSEEKFAQAFYHNTIPMTITTIGDGRHIEVNDAFLKATGYTRPEVIGQTSQSLHLFFDPVQREQARRAMIDQGRVDNLEVQLRGKNGELSVGLFSAHPVHVGAEPCWLATMLDITERKKIEIALHQSEERYRLLVELSPDAMAIYCDGVVRYVNQAAVRLSRAQDSSQLVGQRALRFVHRELRAMAFERIHHMMTTGEPTPLADEKFLRLDGSVVDVEVASILTTYDGKPAAQVIFREITRRKQAEVALQQSEQRFRRTFDEAPVGALLVSPRQEFLRVNQAFCQWLGYDEAELLQMNMAAITHPDDRQESRENVQALLDGKVDQFEMEKRYLRKDGQVVWGRVSVVLMRDDAGTPLYFLPMIQDITQAKKAEREIWQLNADLEQRVHQRTIELEAANIELEAANRELESFTYSVSHDLRAPLRGIEGYSKILMDGYNDVLEGDGLHYLNRLRESAQWMTRLVNDLLDLSRFSQAQIAFVQVKLSELAQTILTELQENQPERNIETMIMPNLVAWADENLMRVVLDNLLRNAWKFTGRQPHARIEFGSQNETGALIYFVRDNGAGFDMAYADKLFMAFQRLHTEAEFEGTGIGLTIVQRIIHRHGGRVWAEGAPEQGATFYFTISQKAT